MLDQLNFFLTIFHLRRMKLLLAAVVLFFYLSFSLKTTSANSLLQERCNFTSSLFRPGLMEDIKELIKQEVQRQRYIGESSQYAAYSCDEIREIKPCQDAGEYWILDKHTGTSQRQYCHSTMTFNNTWTLVAKVNMRYETNCPGGLLMNNAGAKRLCQSPLVSGSCYSVQFPVNRKTYKWVRGKVIGYQSGTTNAFGDQSSGDFNTAVREINDQYIDGVSITHGRPRKHIWTFAVGYNHNEQEKWQCPCTYSNYRKSEYIPFFVGEAYYCDIGTHSSSGPGSDELILSNALWDGENCVPSTSCCDNPSLPWFERELPSATTDDIELRICRDQDRNNEDILLEVIELYIR